ncbi:MAG TPA: PIG-L family deacetylase [Microthrixaceae bacterium]|nr:PIG-L family deacetylase [Microthrixaceae bacterium]
MSDLVDPLPPGGPTSRDLPTPDRALVIVAHPDDAEFQAGATLAKWAAAGCRVTHLVLTDGSKGTWDPDQDPAALVAARHDEQRAAATVLGAEDPIFLDLIDGELVSGIVERGRVAEVIRRVRPDVVVGHDGRAFLYRYDDLLEAPVFDQILGEAVTGAVTTAIGDIDRDGDADLVLARRGDNAVLVYAREGNGYADATPLLIADPAGVAVGHVDGDCVLDLAVMRTQTVGLFLGDP